MLIYIYIYIYIKKNRVLRIIAILEINWDKEAKVKHPLKLTNIECFSLQLVEVFPYVYFQY